MAEGDIHLSIGRKQLACGTEFVGGLLLTSDKKQVTCKACLTAAKSIKTEEDNG